MTTADLYKKHISGQISKEKFLYEVRRDFNLPWILNTTSYADAVKILKNKGIIAEDKTPATSNKHIEYYIASVKKNNPEGITISTVVEDDVAKDTGDLYKICLELSKAGLLNYSNKDKKIEPADVESILDSREHLSKVSKSRMNEVEVPEGIESKILELKEIQDKLDSALASYKDSIKDLEASKGVIVPEVLQAFEGQTEGAKHLKFEVKGLIVKLVGESEKSSMSYKTLAELLEEELIKLNPAIATVIEELKRSSYIASTVKAQLNIGGSKVYEVKGSDFYTKVLKALNKTSIKLEKGIKDAEDSIHSIESALSPVKENLNEITQSSDTNKAKDGKVKEYTKLPEINVRPNTIKIAIEHELMKKHLDISNVDIADYNKAHDKVVKALTKDPKCYDHLIFANHSEIEKADEKLKMQPVTAANIKDTDNQMKKIKGQDTVKSNTKSSTKENKKGMPKGVKELTYTAKKAKGIKKTMPPTGKEKLLEAIKTVLKEDIYNEFEYGLNHKVKTPDGEGTIVKSTAGTLTIHLGDGVHKDYQINIIRHHNNPENSKVNSTEEKPEMKEGGCSTCERNTTLMEKMKAIIKKLASKKGSKLVKEKLTTQDIQDYKTGKKPGIPNVAAGTPDEAAAKQAKLTYTSYK